MAWQSITSKEIADVKAVENDKNANRMFDLIKEAQRDINEEPDI